MISLINAKKSFDSKTVINNLTYEFPDKGVYHITGSSGSGKTTLLRIIAGLEKLDTGTVTLVESLSFAFQEYRLFPWLNALDNVLVATRKAHSEADVNNAKALLKRLGFTEEELSLLPKEMSGGMKQRVSLARAFITNSDVLLLDEPTKELDARLVNVVYEIITEMACDRLIILTTHQPPPEDFKIDGILSIENDNKTCENVL